MAKNSFVVDGFICFDWSVTHMISHTQPIGLFNPIPLARGGKRGKEGTPKGVNKVHQRVKEGTPKEVNKVH